jgi:hypothetical protein
MACGILFYLCFFAAMVMRGLYAEAIDDEDGDGIMSCQERVNASVRAIAHWNPLTLTIFISIIIIPPLLVGKVFSPCWSCYDFESTALHEIGHFLGFGHPNNLPENLHSYYATNVPTNVPQNVYHVGLSEAVRTGVRPPNDWCLNPWQDVREGTPPGFETEDSITAPEYQIVSAQMEAQTQFNPRPCLTTDDFEILSVNYPDCSDYSLTETVCHKVQHNIGNVRLAIYVAFPVFVALMCVICFSSVVHGFERREKERMQKAKGEFRKKESLVGKVKVIAEARKKRLSAHVSKYTPAVPGIATSATS